MQYIGLFPGQGSQSLGMGKALAEAYPQAREVFERVDSALSQHLSKIMWGESEEELTKTENAQPALMAVSLAVVRVLETHVPDFIEKAAGHSLGEYSAYTAGGSFSIEDAASLLKRRGQAMQQAVHAGEGAMAAVLGLDSLGIQEALARMDFGQRVCSIANDNSEGQVVLSGHKDAVEKAAEALKELGARKVVMLSVSAPFHCRLMQPAAEVMKDALAEVDIQLPKFPVISNVTLKAAQSVEEIRQSLVDQVTGVVRWRETMHLFLGEKKPFLELGQGKVLTGLIKKQADTIFSLQSPEDIEAFINKG